MNTYLINGITENWERAFSYNPPIWGFTDRKKGSWEALKENDTIYFYASGRARGIIGKGLILNRIHDEQKLIWPEEIESGTVKWPWRFYFNPIVLLNLDLWEAGNGPVPCSEFGMSGASLQGKQIVPLNDEQIKKIEEPMSLWIGVSVGINPPPVGVEEVPEPETKFPDFHTELITIIADMGKLQSFYPQSEFSIPNENRRVDVVWRREIHGVPTYAFEVELSGGIDRSLNKLYRCHQLFNTLPRMITPPEEHGKIEKISSSLGFKEKIIALTPEQIKDIYKKKKDFKDLEQVLKLL